MARRIGKQKKDNPAGWLLSGLGAQDGLDYDFDRACYGNSFDAHWLIHLASTLGVQTQMEERLFRA
ncbi:MAG TPA: hypothetical protein VD840_03810 [Sinorhizobium sp.]|nr:hypothetical protein [Sinorhizobium sp.]